MTIASYVFLMIGALFYLLGGLGVLRMPDTFNRIQAGTKATTLGSFSMILGVLFAIIESHPNWIFKLVILLILIALSNPVGSSTIAKAIYKSKTMQGTLLKDDLKDRGENQ